VHATGGAAAARRTRSRKDTGDAGGVSVEAGGERRLDGTAANEQNGTELVDAERAGAGFVFNDVEEADGGGDSNGGDEEDGDGKEAEEEEVEEDDYDDDDDNDGEDDDDDEDAGEDDDEDDDEADDTADYADEPFLQEKKIAVLWRAYQDLHVQGKKGTEVKLAKVRLCIAEIIGMCESHGLALRGKKWTRLQQGSKAWTPPSQRGRSRATCCRCDLFLAGPVFSHW